MTRPAPTIRATTTAVFGFHNLSKRKRAMLYDAMRRSHRAYRTLVERLLDRLDEIAEQPTNTARKHYMAEQIVYPARRGWPLSQSAEACARTDAIAAIESYLQQHAERPTVGQPRTPRLETVDPDHDRALDDLAVLADDRAREHALRSELMRARKHHHPRPLGLYGYGHFYRLLRHTRTGRLYAWINLHPQSSRFARRRRQSPGNRESARQNAEMIDIVTGKREPCTKKTWELFPLAFGHDYHERRFLNDGTPKGARIVYRPEADRFELHVIFVYTRQRIEPETLMGVKRGFMTLAAWAVTDSDGNVRDSGEIGGEGLQRSLKQEFKRLREAQKRGRRLTQSKRRAYADEIVHATANTLVEQAVRHRARIVLEDLNVRRVHARPKGAPRSPANAVLTRQQYQKLKAAIEYKARVRGLPLPRYVQPAGTARMCPECGNVNAGMGWNRNANGPAWDGHFRCEACGHVDGHHRNAARIIALKGAWLAQVPARTARSERPLHDAERFPQYLRDAAQRRRGSSGAPAPVPS